MKTCDLHCHSNISDGTCTPEEVIEEAVRAGVSAVALTDHNTTEGLVRAAQAAAGRIEFCGGCEFTASADGREVHLLGLFLDPERIGPLQVRLAEQRRRKEESNRATIERLAAAGYPLDWGEFTELFGGGVKNRLHIAQYLTEKGAVPDKQAAFHELLAPGGRYYQEPEKLDLYELIPLIAACGGVSVWAHPLFHVDRTVCEEILRKAVPCGLDGAEVYYTTYSQDDTAFMQEMCRKYRLLCSGGSDFHGANKPDVMPGRGKGNLRIPYACFEALKQRAEERMACTADKRGSGK